MSKDLKTVLADLKKLLFSEDAPAPAPAPEMVSVKGKDGVEYYVDKLETGSVMNTKDDAGALVPVAPGDYELEDGTKVTVAEGGVIESIAAAEAVQPEEMQAPTNAQEFADAIAQTEAATGEDKIAKMGIVLRALVNNVFGWQMEEQKRKQEIDAAMAIMKEGFEKMNREKFEAVFNAIQAVADLPAADSVKDRVVSPFSRDTKAGIQDVVKAFQSLNEKK